MTAGFTTDTTAETLAGALVDAVKNDWLKPKHIEMIAHDFVNRSPLKPSGRQKFLREFGRHIVRIADDEIRRLMR